jgi:hypothetical protein
VRDATLVFVDDWWDTWPRRFIAALRGREDDGGGGARCREAVHVAPAPEQIRRTDRERRQTKSPRHEQSRCRWGIEITAFEWHTVLPPGEFGEPHVS